MNKEELHRIADICKAANVWLVVDDTYEHFVYDGAQHTCVAGSNVIHLFSFSKVSRHGKSPCATVLHSLSARLLASLHL